MNKDQECWNQLADLVQYPHTEDKSKILKQVALFASSFRNQCEMLQGLVQRHKLPFNRETVAEVVCSAFEKELSRKSTEIGIGGGFQSISVDSQTGALFALGKDGVIYVWNSAAIVRDGKYEISGTDTSDFRFWIPMPTLEPAPQAEPVADRAVAFFDTLVVKLKSSTPTESLDQSTHSSTGQRGSSSYPATGSASSHSHCTQCLHCNGSGRSICAHVYKSSWGGEPARETCPQCNGKGRVATL